MRSKIYYTREEYQAAKRVCIAAFLMQNGYELQHTGNSYKGKIHDSLVIQSDGRWYWNSLDLHGYCPIELYKHILINDYGYQDTIETKIEAVKRMAGSYSGFLIPTEENTSTPEPARLQGEPLLLPAQYKNNNRVWAYLCKTRGLDRKIIKELIHTGKLYETVQSWDKEKKCFVDTPYHNAVFLSYDKNGNPQNGFMRGTTSNSKKAYKCDVAMSDKSYGFILPGSLNSNQVILFESFIDAISHKCIYKTDDWRVSLSGFNYAAIDRFLSEQPSITHIISGFDNDTAGDRYSKKLFDIYSKKGYEVSRQIPVNKDWNLDLLGGNIITAISHESDYLKAMQL